MLKSLQFSMLRRAMPRSMRLELSNVEPCGSTSLHKDHCGADPRRQVDVTSLGLSFSCSRSVSARGASACECASAAVSRLNSARVPCASALGEHILEDQKEHSRSIKRMRADVHGET